MSKKELITEVAETLNISKKDTTLVLETIFNKIVDKMTLGEEVNISGFGKFSTKTVDARDYRNPKDGSKVTVEKHNQPKFSFSSTVKNAVK